MTRINTNVSSLVAQNRLQTSNKDLQTALTRLSTGLRINKGSDDPAGLIASEALRSEITSLNKSISNTRRASQIISTADSALGQVSSLLNDIRGLVVEAANSGALSPDEIAANQLQVDSSLEAINRIAQTTTFQGRKLLDGSLDFITTNGTGADSIKNLQIDQANLGATGSIAVTINVATAATQAAVDIDGFTDSIPGLAATGTVGIGATEAIAATGTVEIGTDVTGVASTGVLTIDAGSAAVAASGTFDVGLDEITVTSNTAGAAGNTLTVSFSDNGGGAATAALDGGNNLVVSYDFSAPVTASSISDAINTVVGATGFTAAVTAGDGTGEITGTAIGFTLADGADAVDATEITVTADAEGVAGDVAVTFINDGAATGVTATLNGSAIEVTYNSANAVSAEDIAVAIATAEGFGATVTSGTGSTTASVLATDGALTGGVDASVADTITVTADDGGEAGNVAIRFVNGSALGASINDDGEIEITYDFSTSITAADIEDAINNDVEGFTASGATTGATVAAAGPQGVATTLAGGEEATEGEELTITANTGGLAGNVAVTFVDGGVDADEPTATINSTTGAIEISYNFEAATSSADIEAAINTLAVFTATGAAAGSTVAGVGQLGGELEGGTATTPGGVQANVVFELAGKNGSEVFNVSAGTSLDQVVAQINLVSDATGVSATAEDNTLQLRSSAYGSAAIVDLRILSQATGGNFGSGSRDTGSDIVATVNGRAANGVGNKLSINTATLDLTADLEADFEGDAEFTITGGGAQFQLGPEVVSNQQARVGIGSVNAARLGGVAGKLFELGSGESASLATDPTRAAQIVTEAIDQVTSLRGRLGAFQATTLESNLSSLQDTVANLQEAESSIRDADFAQESAKLTRAQILVQSGTNVLALANQNPQNVLSLLR